MDHSGASRYTHEAARSRPAARSDHSVRLKSPRLSVLHGKLGLHEADGLKQVSIESKR